MESAKPPGESSALWPPFRPWAVVERAGQPESFHEGLLAVVDDAGKTRASWGEPDFPVFLRSSLKMVQAIPFVESLACDAPGLGPQHIAISCSSHCGESFHIAAVQEILESAGLTPEALACGAHWPLHEESRHELVRRGEKARPIHNNCSGKHAGMLATCVRRGWDIKEYLRAEHPLQREIAAILAELAEVDLSSIPHGVDGCGVPTFRLSSVAFARALARFVSRRTLGRHSAAASRTLDAMRAHPEMVAGTGRFCTLLMKSLDRPALAKGGAEGLYVVAWRERSGEGVALCAKSASGDSRSRDFAVTEALFQLGLLDEPGLERLARFHRGALRNYSGTIVGRMISLLNLKA
jgi:L-asparaginase II